VERQDFAFDRDGDRLVGNLFLQCDVVEAYDARSCEFSHQNLLCQSEVRWVRPARQALAMTVVYRNAAAAGLILKRPGTSAAPRARLW
jgi:hypothetical protein